MKKYKYQIAITLMIVFASVFLFTRPPTFKSDSGVPIKAIYLVQDGGQLTKEDLQAHPEVMVTNKFDEFKKIAKSKVALWIDINSIGLVDMGWLGERPQKYYPVVLIGNSKDSCVFFGSLQYFLFEVPAPPSGKEDYCNTITPGYSINILKSESGGKKHGYEEVPTVKGIFDNTNLLLESLK